VARYRVFAQMFSTVFKMERAWKVLRKLDNLPLRIMQEQKHISGARLAGGRRIQSASCIFTDKRFDVRHFVANVQERGRMSAIGAAVELEELPIVDFQIRNRGLAGIIELECLRETQGLVEITRSRNIGDAKSDVRDARKGRPWRRGGHKGQRDEDHEAIKKAHFLIFVRATR